MKKYIVFTGALLLPKLCFATDHIDSEDYVILSVLLSYVIFTVVCNIAVFAYKGAYKGARQVLTLTAFVINILNIAFCIFLVVHALGPYDENPNNLHLSDTSLYQVTALSLLFIILNIAMVIRLQRFLSKRKQSLKIESPEPSET